MKFSLNLLILLDLSESIDVPAGCSWWPAWWLSFFDPCTWMFQSESTLNPQNLSVFPLDNNQ